RTGRGSLVPADPLGSIRTRCVRRQDTEPFLDRALGEKGLDSGSTAMLPNWPFHWNDSSGRRAIRGGLLVSPLTTARRRSPMSAFRFLRVSLFAVVVSGLGAAPIVAQEISGTISGSVADPQGQALPGPTVTPDTARTTA